MPAVTQPTRRPRGVQANTMRESALSTLACQALGNLAALDWEANKGTSHKTFSSEKIFKGISASAEQQQFALDELTRGKVANVDEASNYCMTTFGFEVFDAF